MGSALASDGREPERPLPRGRHSLSPEVVAASQRRRLLQAAVEVVAERGYTAASVTRIVAQARVSREVFYALFASKEACWEAAVTETLSLRGDAVVAAAAEGGDPAALGRRVVRAYVDAVAETELASRCIAAELPPGATSIRVARGAVRDAMAEALGGALGSLDPFAARAFVVMLEELVDERLAVPGRGEVAGVVGPAGRMLEALVAGSVG